VFAGVSALVVQQAAVISGRPNPRSISASLLGQSLTSYRQHSDQPGTESVSRSHARYLASTDAKSSKNCSGTESSAAVVHTTPRTSDLGGEMRCIPVVAERLDGLRSEGSVNLLGSNNFRRWPISPSAPTAARPVRICARWPRRECRRTGTRGYCCQRSWRESWPAGSRR
jgi:hypothetical protein